MFNTRSDLDAASAEQRNQFMKRLALSINKWRWNGTDWEQYQNTTDIERFGFTVSDFPDAPVPEKPAYNLDKRNLQRNADDLIEQLGLEYTDSLQRGFTYDGGTFPSTGPKRNRVVELVVQQNAGRGMPRGKTTKRFFDLEGIAHDFTASEIVDLAEKGSDLVEAADDNYESLTEQIEKATSQAELDAIDVTAGWPN